MTASKNPVPIAPESSAPQVPVRASDADREQVVQALHAAVGRGLLTFDEADERITAAYRSRMLRDLAPLLADLPAPPAPHQAPPGWRALVTLFWLQLQSWLHAGSRTVRGHRWNPRLALVALLLAALVVGVLVGIAPE